MHSAVDACHLLSVCLSPRQAEKTEETSSARERLAGMAGTSSAFYDLDSDGYGLKSRENVKTMAPADVKSVEKALKEKARYLIYLRGGPHLSHLAWCIFGLCFAPTYFRPDLREILHNGSEICRESGGTLPPSLPPSCALCLVSGGVRCVT